jgi:hypothetical protein
MTINREKARTVPFPCVPLRFWSRASVARAVVLLDPEGERSPSP